MTIRQLTAASGLAAFLLLPGAAAAQTPAERDLARLTIAKHDAAIVTVLGTARVRVTMGGREAPPTEENLSATAVVIDATGLMAAPLSALDPGRMMSSLMGRMAGGGAEAMDARSELSNLRVRLADGREVPARIALRDEDLDVAFLRPVDPPASPWPFVETAAATPRAMDLLVVVDRLGEMAGRQTAAQFVSVMAVIDKPRTLYLVAAAGGGAAFDAEGRLVGLTVMMSKPSTGASPAGPMSMLAGGMSSLDAMGLMPVVVPIEDIRQVARQAK